jgi:hypothetical protein
MKETHGNVGPASQLRPGCSAMIGLVASRADLGVAEEFFELFKTPWEQAVPGRKYRVILSTDGSIEGLDGEVFLVYGSGELKIDRETGVAVDHVSGPVDSKWGESTFPIYGEAALFDGDTRDRILGARGKFLDYRYRTESSIVRRIGYDLFEEIRHLLTKGQPTTQALTPTLEFHIALLRYLLFELKIPFLEIPPHPEGHDFICCLTHDVDFYGIRRHKFDRTLAGFIYRASVGTLADLVRGRRSLAEAARNWLAFCSLPFVFLGVVPDFWRPFEDYAKVEDERRSTFFLVPFKGRPGLAPDGSINAWRATPYGIADIEGGVRKASDRGSELAVHGIDAWRDADAGREEMRQLNSLTDKKTAGIRMHWLYFAEDSPRRLEDAGFDYDSTWGYNEAVGYRAGTSQVFRPVGSETLMELPMSIMDSALFSSGRMNLGREKASQLCCRIVANARRFGGTLVINWHERSLAPERLWGGAYRELLGEVGKGDRAWFARAGEAVEWFRWRRSIRFHQHAASDVAQVRVSVPRLSSPGAVIRIHRTGVVGSGVEDVAFDGATAVQIEV